MWSENLLSAAGVVASGLTSFGMLAGAVRMASWLARRVGRAAVHRPDGERLGRSAAWSEEGRLARPPETAADLLARSVRHPRLPG